MKYPILIILAIVALIVGAGVGYFLDIKTVAEPENEPVVNETREENVPVVVSSDGQIVDCGRAIFDSSALGGGGEMVDVSKNINNQAEAELSCFNERFKTCSPAILIEGIDGFAIARYEVFGPDEDGCLTGISFEENILTELVGPKMTCVRDNSGLFNKQEFENCSGELYNLMKEAGLLAG